MKVIVTWRNFHDIDREEIMPEVFKVNENETAEDVLRRIWDDHYDDALMESQESHDWLDKEKCWCKEDMAQIGWEDGDTKEFFIADVEEWR